MKLIKYPFLAVILIFLVHTKITGSPTPDTTLMRRYTNDAIRLFEINNDSSLKMAQKAYDLAVKSKSDKYTSLALQQLGACFLEKEDISKAIKYFHQALDIEEKRKNEIRIADLNNDLGYIYINMEKYPKASQYFNTALVLFKKNNDTTGIIKTNFLLGLLNISREFCENRTQEEKQSDYKIALNYYLQNLELCTKIKSGEGQAKCYSNLGNTYRKLQQFEKSVYYNQLAIEYFRKNNNWKSLVGVLRNQAKTFTYLKRYSESAKLFDECVKMSKEHNLTGGIQFVYEDMAYNYECAGNYKAAKEYYVQYMILRDSIYNSEKSKQIFELETRYQTEKKEKEIILLVAQKRKKNIFIILLVSLITIGFVISFYLVNRHRSKRIIAEQNNRINEQKIKEFEKERQLVATQSVLKGEEAERSRLARDLHDGLGGLLSGVKLKLSSLKGNYITSQVSIEQFDIAVNLLDNSIKELRRVAHNMMPESLVKFGLKDALQDFCEQISAGKDLKIEFHFFGENNRFHQPLETTVYRITQELINNAIKHAHASQIIVQLLRDTDRVHLTVQDNGKGFDPAKVDIRKSAGLQNIKVRVESFNGFLNIYSKPNEGTEISIEFRL